eukprot:TRINITY_DN23064_c0_g1_i1.p1 TRINITY_DN23064_c0_g1~~TRINITY_DN23064_c0_g1_i1.p1  ORF type:complete len:972 (+),score=184.69 TRINITY_DN23064_c0_g1_i1:149-3064(+)
MTAASAVSAHVTLNDFDGYWQTVGNEINLIEGRTITAPDGNRLPFDANDDGGFAIEVGGHTHCAQMADGELLWDDGDVWRRLSEPFVALSGKDAFPNAVAHEMQVMDIDVCKHFCMENGYGAFAVRNGRAYFRTASAERCRRQLVDSFGCTLYLCIDAGGRLEQRATAPVLDAASEIARGVGADDISVALAESFEAEQQHQRLAVERPGAELSGKMLADFGVAFERQPDSSDTCAVHALNNLVQRDASPEDAAATRAMLEAAAVAAEAAAAAGEEVELGGICSGPFAVHDLQQAEAESRSEELNASFLMPPTEQHLSALRSTSGHMSPSASSAPPRTGMFDVEAIKIAARAKGFEVIDTEPKPEWAETAIANYIDAARATAVAESGANERWFLGFLVYERIPGFAMHYYSILHWPMQANAGAQGSSANDQHEAKFHDEAWLLLDSMDRGSKHARNRFMTFPDLVQFYEMNSEWFRSWLVRWYPIVRKSAAVSALQRVITSKVSEICEDSASEICKDSVSSLRAEGACESSRWNVLAASEQLLKAQELVGRELLVLRLALNETRARELLAAAEWNLDTAVRERMECVLGHRNPVVDSKRDDDSNVATKSSDATDFSLLTSPQSSHATYLALRMTDWDIRSAAQLLLVSARAGAAETALRLRLEHALAALKASAWDADRALGVLRLLRTERARLLQGHHGTAGECGSDSPPIEETAFQVLNLTGFDELTALALLKVCVEFPNAPLAVCAEALRRGDSHAASACELLREFKTRVQNLVAKIGKSDPSPKAPGLRGQEEESELALLALDAAEWNPGVAFKAAESFTLGIVQVRSELLRLEGNARKQAVDVVQKGTASEDLVAVALAVIDSLDAALLNEQSLTSLLDALREADMCPKKAAASVWQSLLPGGVLSAVAQQQVPPPRHPEKGASKSLPAPTSKAAQSASAKAAQPKSVAKGKAKAPGRRQGDEACCSM